MSTAATAQATAAPERGGAVRPAIAAVATGVAAVVLACMVGALLAGLLVLLGLTTTAVPLLGAWLAGLGVLGGWTQSVSATVGGGLEWSSWAAGAPLLVTVAAAAAVLIAARRSRLAPLPGAGLAGAGAAVAAVVLVLASRVSHTTTNSAGSVTTDEGLTWWWTGGIRPGTVVGAAVLVACTWWVSTAGREWWLAGRAFVVGLVVLPSLVVTLLLAAGLVYLTSSPAVGVALVALAPMAGLLAVLGGAGAPVLAGVTRLSPEPYVLWTWSGGWVLGVVGLVAVLALAVVVGWVLRARGHPGGWVAPVVVTALAAAALTWAADAQVAVPPSLGDQTRLSASPLVAAVVGAVLALVARAVRGSRP